MGHGVPWYEMSWPTYLYGIFNELFKTLVFDFFWIWFFLTTDLVFCKKHCTPLGRSTEKLLTFLKFEWLDLPEVSPRPRRFEPFFWVIGAVLYFFLVFRNLILSISYFFKVLFSKKYFSKKKCPQKPWKCFLCMHALQKCKYYCIFWKAIEFQWRSLNFRKSKKNITLF